MQAITSERLFVSPAHLPTKPFTLYFDNSELS